MFAPSVWRFDTPDGAEKAVRNIGELSQERITVHDAATASWQPGAKKPTRQLQDLTGAVALGSAFWSMLFGLLLLVPMLGAAIGAAAGALGRLTDVGIDDTFVKRAREEITPPHRGAVRAHLRRRVATGSRTRSLDSAATCCSRPDQGAEGHPA